MSNTPYDITPLHQFMADLHVAGMATEDAIHEGYDFALNKHLNGLTRHPEPLYRSMQTAAACTRAASTDLGLSRRSEAPEEASHGNK